MGFSGRPSKRKSRPAGKSARRLPSRGWGARQAILPVAAVLLAVGVMVATQPQWITGHAPPRDAVRLEPLASSAAVTPASAPTPLHNTFEAEPKTLHDLLGLADADLHKVDIARMNLLCATGLPGAEGLDVEHALGVLDDWAHQVDFETRRHLYRVHHPRYAAHYRGSEAVLRASFLLQTLQEDLGVKYDPKAVGNFSFADASVAFIHGMIPGPGQTVADMPGGTCTSMPVLYTAVGRRLGYPLKLALTDRHIFVRWDGEDHPNPTWRERFNIEGTGEGFSIYDDAYYANWPTKLTDHQVRVNRFLVSLTPTEEFALFTGARGHNAYDNGAFGFATRCYENAYRYDPTRPRYRGWFLDAALRTPDYEPITPPLIRALALRRAQQEQARRAKRDPFADPFTGQPFDPWQYAPAQARPPSHTTAQPVWPYHHPTAHGVHPTHHPIPGTGHSVHSVHAPATFHDLPPTHR